MTVTRTLTDEEFHACFAEPMKDVTSESEAFLNIWPYVASLTLSSWDITEVLNVVYVYRGGDGAYEQVLIETDKFNSLLVIVLDLRSKSIFGHHILDLNEKYGLA